MHAPQQDLLHHLLVVPLDRFPSLVTELKLQLLILSTDGRQVDGLLADEVILAPGVSVPGADVDLS